MIARTGRRLQITPGADTRQVQSVMVPLRLRENEVGLVKLVQFNYCSTNPQLDLSMFLSARNDIPVPAVGAELDRLEEFLQASDGTIASFCFNDDRGIGQIIPVPSFPVVGDMQWIVDVTPDVADAITHKAMVSVYYDRMKVSADEWLKYAKRSRNAPADLMPFSVFNSP